MPCDTMLIAYDGSENAKRAITYAGRILTTRRAVVLTAWEPVARQAARLSGVSGLTQTEWLPEDEYIDIAHADAEYTNDEGVRLARLAGLNAEARIAECDSTIWNTIVEVADDLDADIIVAGTRGATGLRSLMHSSVAEAVLKHGHRPVLLVPPCREPDA